MRVLVVFSALTMFGFGCATSSESRPPPEQPSAPIPPQDTSPDASPAPALDPAVRERARKILDAALSSADAEERGEALTAVGLARTADAQDILTAALADPNGNIRFAAARGLRHLGAPQTADAITTAWQKEKGWSVKKELALAAGAAKAQALVPELQAVLQKEQRQELKVAAAWALQDMGDPRGAAALSELGNPPRPGAQKEGTDRWSRKVLQGTREGDRVLAVRILAEAGTREDLPLLTSLLDDAAAVVRILASAGILRLSESS